MNGRKKKGLVRVWKTVSFLTGLFFCYAFLFILLPNYAAAATLSASPTAGTFTVGSTFEVSIFLNSQGKAVNAVEASLSFPPDKLQLVSPSTGKSVIGVWTVQPNVNNQTGRIDLQGGIPGGVNVSNGLVTTLTFRVKSVGNAIIRFLDNSKVLLHDGKGTNDLSDTTNGVYSLILPPPQGPVVTSETHPDQSNWYSNPNIVLLWANDSQVEGYSYVFSDTPVDIPDDILDSLKNTVTYRNQADGIHYFHIKALRGGNWGGTTHFAVKVDTSAPAEFPLEIIPSSRTVRRQPIVSFETTDALSGVDHYEIKLVPLQGQKTDGSQPLFIEVTSPYVPPELDLGKYDIIVRVYDYAGNIREQSKRLSIVTTVFEFVSSEGLQISGRLVLKWKWFFPALILLVIILLTLARRYRKIHFLKHEHIKSGVLPENVEKQLKELNLYRNKYGKMLLVLFVLLGTFLSSVSVKAQESAFLSPPLLQTVSSEITNQDIFYAGGFTELSNVEVLLYLQNTNTGETLNFSVNSDKKGEWFYTHSGFLVSGNYLIWAQTKVGKELSAPSPQQTIFVRQTALQFGGNRISHELIYLILTVIFLLATLGLLLYLVFHAYHARKKHKMLIEKIRQAEESIKRGFALVRKDIESELQLLNKVKLSKELSQQEKIREAQLMKDLSDTENYVSQEIWQMEKIEQQE